MLSLHQPEDGLKDACGVRVAAELAAMDNAALFRHRLQEMPQSLQPQVTQTVPMLQPQTKRKPGPMRTKSVGKGSTA